jgi:NADPH-dependent 2,4-dienoyl-CoA reductase/sulfur reductase-like enzyme
VVLVGAEGHWPPYDRPPLSKQVLTGAWDSERVRLRVGDPFDADLVLGRRAVALDLAAGSVGLDDGTSVAFDGLVIATGATPRSLPGTETIAGVHVLRTLDDCVALRHDLDSARRVVVVGAGFIGCEVAASCRTLGLDVALVEALELPLVRVLGPQMGAVAADLHRANGVALLLGIGVRAIEGDSRVERVILGDGSSLDADVVVVGIGVTPETGWLDGSGLAIDDGVVCDEACVATGSGGRVVAAGDVARWTNPLYGESMRIEHWTNAGEQAAHAVRALVYGAEAAGGFAPVPYFWSDQYTTKLQFLGTCARDDEVLIVEGSVEAGKFVAAYGRGGTTVGALCVNCPPRTIPWRQAIEARAPFPPPAEATPAGRP